MQAMDIARLSPAMAPMAGVTDLACRLVARRHGCRLAFTEMISANALVYENLKTINMLKTTPEDHPVGVQLFGGAPGVMAEAAAIVSEMPFDIIDINMGCPAPKVVKNAYGAALMLDRKLAGDIIKNVVRSTQKPVTVKIRKGWDESHVNAVEIAVIAEACGAAAITVHGRTRSQFYSGRADWDIIRQVKQAVNIPVFGNGDVFSAEDAARMLCETGCDGVAVGRGARGNPWIFKEIIEYLNSGTLSAPPTPRERVETAVQHLRMVLELKGEKVGVKEMRKHIAWYIKGIRESAKIKRQVFEAETADEVLALLEGFISALD